MLKARKNSGQKKPTYFLRPHEVVAAERDRASQMAIIESSDTRLNKSEAASAIRRIDERLQQAPPDLTPDQRDKTAKMVENLESELKDGLLSHEEMRRCPPGAVDQNKRWLNRNKAKALAWKNGLAALNKGIDPSEASDLFSLERLRPRTSKLNMDGAIIPDVKSFYPMAEVFSGAHPNGATWDEIFGSGDPEKDAMAKQLREMQEQLAKLTAATPAAPAPQAQKAPQPQQHVQRR